MRGICYDKLTGICPKFYGQASATVLQADSLLSSLLLHCTSFKLLPIKIPRQSSINILSMQSPSYPSINSPHPVSILPTQCPSSLSFNLLDLVSILCTPCPSSPTSVHSHKVTILPIKCSFSPSSVHPPHSMSILSKFQSSLPSVYSPHSVSSLPAQCPPFPPSVLPSRPGVHRSHPVSILLT